MWSYVYGPVEFDRTSVEKVMRKHSKKKLLSKLSNQKGISKRLSHEALAIIYNTQKNIFFPDEISSYSKEDLIVYLTNLTDIIPTKNMKKNEIINHLMNNNNVPTVCTGNVEEIGESVDTLVNIFKMVDTFEKKMCSPEIIAVFREKVPTRQTSLRLHYKTEFGKAIDLFNTWSDNTSQDVTKLKKQVNRVQKIGIRYMKYIDELCKNTEDSCNLNNVPKDLLTWYRTSTVHKKAIMCNVSHKPDNKTFKVGTKLSNGLQIVRVQTTKSKDHFVIWMVIGTPSIKKSLSVEEEEEEEKEKEEEEETKEEKSLFRRTALGMWNAVKKSTISNVVTALMTGTFNIKLKQAVQLTDTQTVEEKVQEKIKLRPTITSSEKPEVLKQIEERLKVIDPKDTLKSKAVYVDVAFNLINDMKNEQVNTTDVEPTAKFIETAYKKPEISERVIRDVAQELIEDMTNRGQSKAIREDVAKDLIQAFMKNPDVCSLRKDDAAKKLIAAMSNNKAVNVVEVEKFIETIKPETSRNIKSDIGRAIISDMEENGITIIPSKDLSFNLIEHIFKYPTSKNPYYKPITVKPTPSAILKSKMNDHGLFVDPSPPIINDPGTVKNNVPKLHIERGKYVTDPSLSQSPVPLKVAFYKGPVSCINPNMTDDLLLVKPTKNKNEFYEAVYRLRQIQSFFNNNPEYKGSDKKITTIIPDPLEMIKDVDPTDTKTVHILQSLANVINPFVGGVTKIPIKLVPDLHQGYNYAKEITSGISKTDMEKLPEGPLKSALSGLVHQYVSGEVLDKGVCLPNFQPNPFELVKSIRDLSKYPSMSSILTKHTGASINDNEPLKVIPPNVVRTDQSINIEYNIRASDKLIKSFLEEGGMKKCAANVYQGNWSISDYMTNIHNNMNRLGLTFTSMLKPLTYRTKDFNTVDWMIQNGWDPQFLSEHNQYVRQYEKLQDKLLEISNPVKKVINDPMSSYMESATFNLFGNTPERLLTYMRATESAISDFYILQDAITASANPIGTHHSIEAYEKMRSAMENLKQESRLWAIAHMKQLGTGDQDPNKSRNLYDQARIFGKTNSTNIEAARSQMDSIIAALHDNEIRIDKIVSKSNSIVKYANHMYNNLNDYSSSEVTHNMYKQHIGNAILPSRSLTTSQAFALLDPTNSFKLVTEDVDNVIDSDMFSSTHTIIDYVPAKHNIKHYYDKAGMPSQEINALRGGTGQPIIEDPYIKALQSKSSMYAKLEQTLGSDYLSKKFQTFIEKAENHNKVPYNFKMRNQSYNPYRVTTGDLFLNAIAEDFLSEQVKKVGIPKTQGPKWFSTSINSWLVEKVLSNSSDIGTNFELIENLPLQTAVPNILIGKLVTKNYAFIPITVGNKKHKINAFPIGMVDISKLDPNTLKSTRQLSFQPGLTTNPHFTSEVRRINKISNSYDDVERGKRLGTDPTFAGTADKHGNIHSNWFGDKTSFGIQVTLNTLLKRLDINNLYTPTLEAFTDSIMALQRIGNDIDDQLWFETSTGIARTFKELGVAPIDTSEMLRSIHSEILKSPVLNKAEKSKVHDSFTSDMYDGIVHAVYSMETDKELTTKFETPFNIIPSIKKWIEYGTRIGSRDVENQLRMLREKGVTGLQLISSYRNYIMTTSPELINTIDKMIEQSTSDTSHSLDLLMDMMAIQARHNVPTGGNGLYNNNSRYTEIYNEDRVEPDSLTKHKEIRNNESTTEYISRRLKELGGTLNQENLQRMISVTQAVGSSIKQSKTNVLLKLLTVNAYSALNETDADESIELTRSLRDLIVSMNGVRSLQEFSGSFDTNGPNTKYEYEIQKGIDSVDRTMEKGLQMFPRLNELLPTIKGDKISTVNLNHYNDIISMFSEYSVDNMSPKTKETLSQIRKFTKFAAQELKNEQQVSHVTNGLSMLSHVNHYATSAEVMKNHHNSRVTDLMVDLNNVIEEMTNGITTTDMTAKTSFKALTAGHIERLKVGHRKRNNIKEPGLFPDKLPTTKEIIEKLPTVEEAIDYIPEEVILYGPAAVGTAASLMTGNVIGAGIVLAKAIAEPYITNKGGEYAHQLLKDNEYYKQTLENFQEFKKNNPTLGNVGIIVGKIGRSIVIKRAVGGVLNNIVSWTEGSLLRDPIGAPPIIIEESEIPYGSSSEDINAFADKTVAAIREDSSKLSQIARSMNIDKSELSNRLSEVNGAADLIDMLPELEDVGAIENAEHLRFALSEAQIYEQVAEANKYAYENGYDISKTLIPSEFTYLQHANYNMKPPEFIPNFNFARDAVDIIEPVVNNNNIPKTEFIDYISHINPKSLSISKYEQPEIQTTSLKSKFDFQEKPKQSSIDQMLEYNNENKR